MTRRVALADYRSYPALDLAIDSRMVALTGDNGAGKTNLIEALSLFTPGRGLRRAEFGDCARLGGSGGWAVSIELTRDEGDDPDATVRLGVGVEAGAGEGAPRQFRVDRAPEPSARVFADHLRIVWLTPAMDGLFAAAAGERRRFLDRLVLAVDSDHGARVAALERALRNRNRLLEMGTRDAAWLDAAERELAELAVAVAAARVETAARLAALIAAGRDDASPFPWASIRLDGDIEAMIGREPALAIEDRYRALLRAGRARDAAAGRTLVGPHRADLLVRHGPKDVEAALCSTGEQKALLVGLALAHARLVAEMSGVAPLVLLDEIAAHFDPKRRAALFAALEGIGGQVWMTGADPAAFADMPAGAQRLRVSPGRVEPA
ncbi:MAG: DNA replication/repair protein RecF [Methylobacteriaceae bacterium]|nr:DNA replication/repair protein RecF [Methylobacteriaceae bacterium]